MLLKHSIYKQDLHLLKLDRTLSLHREHINKVQDQPLSAHADRMLTLQTQLVSIAQKHLKLLATRT